MKEKRITIKFIDGEIYRTTDWDTMNYNPDNPMLTVKHQEDTDMFQVSQIKYVAFDEVEER